MRDGRGGEREGGGSCRTFLLLAGVIRPFEHASLPRRSTVLTRKRGDRGGDLKCPFDFAEKFFL